MEVVELREHARDLADNLVTGFPNASLRAALDTVVGADGLIAVTPIFSASYSGLFKTFFDVVDKDALTRQARPPGRDGRDRAALAGARARAAAAVRLPAHGRRADRGLRGGAGLGRGRRDEP